MKLDYNRLNELLNAFGLFLKFENGNAIFIDVETNTPMKSYVVYKEGFADQKEEYTSEINILLNGFEFFIENSEKKYRLIISKVDNNFVVRSITKDEKKDSHFCKRTVLDIDSERLGTAYNLKEYNYNGDFTGTEFRVWEMDKQTGEIRVSTSEDENNYSGITFKKEPTTYLRKDKYYTITDQYGFYSDNSLSLQDVENLIDQSEIFEKTMTILCPNTTKAYSNIKTNSYGPKK